MSEACNVTGIGRTLMWQILRREEIPSVRIGKRRLVLVEDLRTWLLKKRDEQVRAS